MKIRNAELKDMANLDKELKEQYVNLLTVSIQGDPAAVVRLKINFDQLFDRSYGARNLNVLANDLPPLLPIPDL